MNHQKYTLGEDLTRRVVYVNPKILENWPLSLGMEWIQLFELLTKVSLMGLK
jgi:hypothetical protein